jgi:hypothetical protein
LRGKAAPPYPFTRKVGMLALAYFCQTIIIRKIILKSLKT